MGWAEKEREFYLPYHVHNSGFNNIEYAISVVLMSTTGIAFTFHTKGV
jgi:hypothetical protein